VLDPIDGTKGFMTGQGYVIGLALLDAHGDAVSLTPQTGGPPLAGPLARPGLPMA
jgi:3'-phosphoadenosine 5'-phosphosulfate (PAPS) 3'-phosphatase